MTMDPSTPPRSNAGFVKRSQAVSYVVIGGSAGSITAVQEILKHLKPDFKIPLIIVQHIAATTRIDPAVIYGRFTNLAAVEAQDKMPIQPGHIYFGPPGYHLLVESDLSLSLSQDDLVHYSRPSIEVLFQSVVLANRRPNGGPHFLDAPATSYAAHAAAVLLTGANFDGGTALCELHEKGALTFVQDPKTAEVPTMPLSALKPGYNHEILSLQEIALRLSSLSYEAAP